MREDGFALQKLAGGAHLYMYCFSSISAIKAG
jgi:hypothetical protein